MTAVLVILAFVALGFLGLLLFGLAEVETYDDFWEKDSQP